MALISCPVCGKKISHSAKVCPHCGHMISEGLTETQAMDIWQKKPNASKLLFVVIFVTFAILLFLGSSNHLTPDEKYQVEQVCNLINDIGEADINSGSKIELAEEQYNQLSNKCKRKVKNKSDLKRSKKRWNELNANQVIDQINAIGEVELSSEIEISLAQKSYDSLTDEQKALVKNYNILSDSLNTLSVLKVENVKKLIDNLGRLSADKASKDKLTDAFQAYNLLNADEQAYIDNYDSLLSANETFTNLAIQNCIAVIDRIGEVTLSSELSIDQAIEAYMLVPSERKKEVSNSSKLNRSVKSRQ